MFSCWIKFDINNYQTEFKYNNQNEIPLDIVYLNIQNFKIFNFDLYEKLELLKIENNSSDDKIENLILNNKNLKVLEIIFLQCDNIILKDLPKLENIIIRNGVYNNIILENLYNLKELEAFRHCDTINTINIINCINIKKLLITTKNIINFKLSTLINLEYLEFRNIRYDELFSEIFLLKNLKTLDLNIYYGPPEDRKEDNIILSERNYYNLVFPKMNIKEFNLYNTNNLMSLNLNNLENLENINISYNKNLSKLYIDKLEKIKNSCFIKNNLTYLKFDHIDKLFFDIKIKYIDGIFDYDIDLNDGLEEYDLINNLFLKPKIIKRKRIYLLSEQKNKIIEKCCRCKKITNKKINFRYKIINNIPYGNVNFITILTCC